MEQKSKQQMMAEELQYLEDGINEYMKSIRVAKERLKHGSQTEYGYAKEKICAIKDVAKYVEGRLKMINKKKMVTV